MTCREVLGRHPDDPPEDVPGALVRAILAAHGVVPRA